jgi:Tfp pilus assembly protein PilV
MKYIHRKSGFTLIEVLLYLALSFIMVAVLGNIGIDVLKSRSNQTLREQLFYATERSTLVVEEAMQQANGVLSPAVGDMSSSLILSYENGDEIEFYESNGRLVMNRNGVGEVYLTGSRVEVEELVFINVSSTERDAVRMMFTLIDGWENGSMNARASSSVETTLRVHY